MDLSIIIDFLFKGLEISGPMQQVFDALQKDRLIELKALSGMKRALSVVGQSPYVSEPEPGNEDSSLLRFHFSGTDEQLSELLDNIYKSGTKIVTMREVPLDLEQAYMTVSGLASEHVGEGS